jgi:hypothetical protein
VFPALRNLCWLQGRVLSSIECDTPRTSPPTEGTNEGTRGARWTTKSWYIAPPQPGTGSQGRGGSTHRRDQCRGFIGKSLGRRFHHQHTDGREASDQYVPRLATRAPSTRTEPTGWSLGWSEAHHRHPDTACVGTGTL